MSLCIFSGLFWVWLSVRGQLIVWKDLSPKWPITCQARYETPYSLAYSFHTELFSILQSTIIEYFNVIMIIISRKVAMCHCSFNQLSCKYCYRAAQENQILHLYSLPSIMCYSNNLKTATLIWITMATIPITVVRLNFNNCITHYHMKHSYLVILSLSHSFQQSQPERHTLPSEMSDHPWHNRV